MSAIAGGDCMLKAMILRVVVLCMLVAYAAANVVYLDSSNHDVTIKGSQVAFVAFCADWCPFSRNLKPVFEEAASTFKRDNPDAKVAWGIVDSEKQSEIVNKYYVSKYPTMKVFINGELATKEYRSTRSVDALIAFVKQQLASCVKEFKQKEELDELMDKSKRNIVAYFMNNDSEEYKNFQKISAILREDCTFWLRNDASLTENTIYFKDPDTEDEQKFIGNGGDYNFMKQWLTDKCIPFVREVTFENVEGLTEEGLPFLLYFRNPDNKEDDKKFTESVMRELYDQKTAINALLADGHKFAHPLKHLGKTSSDLPVVAIDSFQHMFLFANMSELHVPGKLRQFVLDLHSEKLHKDFHTNLDQKMIELQKMVIEQPEKFADSGDGPPSAMPIPSGSPPPSVFKDLKPSDQRYSILEKTEL